MQPRVPVWRNKASKPLKKLVGVAVVKEPLGLTGEFVGETHVVLECTQHPPHQYQHQKGPICLWVAGEVAESQQRDKQAVLFPLGPLSHTRGHNPTTRWVAQPQQTPMAPPLTT